MSNYELFALLVASKKRVLIDSCLQHAAAAYKLASTVLSEFNIERSFIFVYGEGDDNLIKSFRNLKNSRIVSVKKLSTYDVVSTDNAVLSKNAMDYLTGEVK
jgi:ribosomal protein L4